MPVMTIRQSSVFGVAIRIKLEIRENQIKAKPRGAPLGPVEEPLILAIYALLASHHDDPNIADIGVGLVGFQQRLR